MVIKGYHWLLQDEKISPEMILDKPDHFPEVTKEYFNILKNPPTDETYDYVWNYKSIDWSNQINVKRITQQAYEIVQKLNIGKEKLLKEQQLLASQQEKQLEEKIEKNKHNISNKYTSKFKIK
ncbi:hypothetical protein [Mycoplasma feriruminatoris]|nr:hypothetical protein [Mycoplasma feriruminatoris]